MTVSRDIEVVLERLRSVGVPPAAADDWLEEQRECWDDRCAMQLIERGETELVLDFVGSLALRD